MRILATNDDGILAPRLWALVGQLKNIAEVVVVAPDREQSATGTAVTLRQPLRVQKVAPLLDGITAYSVEGTPCDSVILALEKLIDSPVDLVVSGINQGLNLGDDMLISGTVGAAMQGYLRGLPAIAISVPVDYTNWEHAARLAGLLAEKIKSEELPQDIFLNVNLPELPLTEIRGIKLTQPAHKTHIDSVDEGYDGRRKYYWLVRQKLNNDAAENTDMWALEQGFVSITTLNTTLFRKPVSGIDDSLCRRLFQQFKQA
jgi:5'-nucleotidase